MQGWQQTLIDERGGADGQNFDDLLQASHEVHQGTNPATRAYNEIRTVRAVLLGAAAFETLCQQRLMESVSDGHAPDDTEVSLERLTPPFENLVYTQFAGFKARAGQDPYTTAPSSSDFGFYEGAHGQIADDYWAERTANGDWTEMTREEIDKFRDDSRNFNYSILSLLNDNVAGSLDILMAMAVGLCVSKQRPCSVEEHSQFIVNNIGMATNLTSASRNQRKGPQAALPYGYGHRVLQGDPSLAKRLYIQVIKGEDGERAQWLHRSLQRGNWLRPGHCPASDYNPLRARTPDEQAALQNSLAAQGLAGLIENGQVAGAQLVIADALSVFLATAANEQAWQDRVVELYSGSPSPT